MSIATDVYTIIFSFIPRNEIKPISKILNAKFLDKFCYHPLPHGTIVDIIPRGHNFVKREIEYKDGKRNGKYIEWIHDSMIKKEYYKNDNKHGQSLEWDLDGSKIAESWYFMGNIEIIF